MPRVSAEGSAPVQQGRTRVAAGSQDPFPRAAALPIIDEIQRAFEALELGRAPDPGPVAQQLVCDLASPIAVGSEPYYRLAPAAAETEPPEQVYEYRWTVRRRTDGYPIWQTVTPIPELRLTAAATGQYVVEVVALADGKPTDLRLSIDHNVEVEPVALTAGLARADATVGQAMRELVADLRPYILEAAAATGSHGITPRLLAAVLFAELLGRPKAARERDLDAAGALLGALERGDRVLDAGWATDRPLGVGQIRPMTAAMVTGDLPWMDRAASHGAGEPGAPDPSAAGYDALSPAAKRAIFTQLRVPKSNIAIVAKLLTALKNRPRRYPALTRTRLAADRGAVSVVAAAYAGLAAHSPAAETGAVAYGSRVWQQMQDPLLRQFFPND